MSWWSQKVQPVLQKAEPFIPVVVAILAPEAAPAIGASLGFTGTAAAVAGGAVVSAGTAAAEGANATQIGQAAVSGGVGSGVGSAVGGGIAGATAGGAAAGGTQAAQTGQNVAQGAAKGAVIGGGSAAAADSVSSALSPGPMSGTGLPTPTSALPKVSTLESAPTSTEGLKIPSSVLTGETVAPAEPQAPGLQYTLSPTVFTPGGVDYGFTQATPTDTLTSTPQTTPGLSPEAQTALQSVFGYGLNLALSPKKTGTGKVGASTTGVASSGGTTGTTSSTEGGSPGGTELDPSTGKAPELAWGDKYTSLKEGLNV